MREPAAGAWADEIDEASWRRALEVLREQRDHGGRLVLACHADPDGDALGSLLALHLFLRRGGWDVTATWGNDPFVVPPQYTFLPGLRTVTPPAAVVGDIDLLVTLDTGSPERLGAAQPLLERAAQTLVVDHHRTGQAYGDISLVAGSAAATAVIVEELLHRLGGVPDRDIATCLYVGLVTDTGGFQYVNTDRAAMELGSRLMDQGIPHEELNRQMFATHSFGYLKVLGRVLQRARFVPAASLVYSWVEAGDLDELGVAVEELEGVIDVLRSVDTAEISMVLKPHAGGWRVSLRSKGRTDVGALAGDLGGGGHTFSAGFTSRGSVDEVADAVVERLRAEREPG